jgi:hypothetical protein
MDVDVEWGPPTTGPGGEQVSATISGFVSSSVPRGLLARPLRSRLASIRASLVLTEAAAGYAGRFGGGDLPLVLDRLCGY